jgi:hypothetical protein
MSAERDVNRIVRSWIRVEEHESADRVLQTVLSRLDTTPQRRHMWPPRRFAHVNKYAQAAIAAAAVLVVAVVGYNLLPRTGGIGGQQTPAPTALQTPSPSPSPSATPGFETVTITPFLEGGMCPSPEFSSDCTEDPRDDSMTFMVEFPEGWASVDEYLPMTLVGKLNGPPDGAGLLIRRGNWLYSDPCRPGEKDATAPEIAVGPTVADFVTALDTHPLLDVTTPVDATLAGYSGKYLELQVPADISECVRYLPIEGTIYAQGPSHRWRYWVLDVEGIRVVIQAYDYPGTSTQHRTELQAIVDSIQIAP